MVKEDLGVSTAELTVGTTLRIPGEFFIDERDTMPETDYGKQLVDCMSTLRPTPSRDPSRRDYFVEAKLKPCTHVFARNDTAWTSLDRVYTGTYRVLGREENYFTLDLGGDRVDNVSINRLKSCSFLLDLPGSIQGSFEEQPLLVVPVTSPDAEISARTSCSPG